MSIYKSPISGGQFVNQPPKRGTGERRFVATLAQATPECKSIDIYVVQTSKLEKLSHLRQGVLQIYKFITVFVCSHCHENTELKCLVILI